MEFRPEDCPNCDPDYYSYGVMLLCDRHSKEAREKEANSGAQTASRDSPSGAP